MAEGKLAQIRAALVTSLKTIKTANGYHTNFPDSHVYSSMDKLIVQLKKDSDYPKVFIVLDDGDSTQLPSSRFEERYGYVIVCIVKRIAPTDNPNVMAENCITDVMQMVDTNRTLSGLILDSKVTDFTTDGGHADPEGVAVIRIEVEYQRQAS